MKTSPLLLISCALLLTAAAWQQTQAAELAGSPAGGPQYAHGRTDNELMATYGTCRQTDIHHFSLLTPRSWDLLAWRSAGDYCGFDSDGSSLGPEYRMALEILVNEKRQPVRIDRVAHQFDCRITEGGTDQVRFRRVDMMVATLQWITAWNCRNVTGGPIRLEYRVCVSDDKRLVKKLAASSDDHLIFQDQHVLHLAAFDQKPEIKVDGTKVTMSWNTILAPEAEYPVCLALRPGWAEAYEDRKRPFRDLGYSYNRTEHGPRILPKIQQLEFQAAAKLLGLPDARLNWPDVVKMSHVKQRRLYAPMPELTGMPAAWEGVWAYTFDLLRVGTKPPQGLLDDIWMTGDPVYYVCTGYWDTAAAAQVYCNRDPDAAARIVLSYLRGGVQEDGHSWIMFHPLYAWHDGPQLPNFPMSLWDCYRVSRNKAAIAEAYPILVRHQDWLDKVWNQTPQGPLADIGHNIDYGCALHQQRHVWLDMNMFQVNQYEMLAKMAGLLGKDTGIVNYWRNKAGKLKQGINRQMWNEADGAYYCTKASDGKQTRVECPIEFYALTTGVADRGQARRLLQRLMDPAKYAPGKKYRYFCPSVAFDDPSFRITDGWGGTIWPIEPYYTVCGLVNYGFQDEASAVSNNLFGMVADEYTRTGSIWEQYRPDNGHGVHLKYFTSGITSTIVDMLLRGTLGFERTDDPASFYLTPRPLKSDWHGVDNLPLSGAIRLCIRVKDQGKTAACRLKFTGLEPHFNGVRIQILDMRSGTKKQVARVGLSSQGEMAVELEKINETRYLWELCGS